MTEALIGAGCFWGIEEYYRKVNGVLDTKVGYSGGKTVNPTYQQVCLGETMHTEVVKISFDEQVLSYDEVLNYFWQCHDSSQLNRQGPDMGTQYRSALYYYNDQQKEIATESKKNKQKMQSKLIVTEISKAKHFYLAEEYHQLYINKTGLNCHI